MQERGTYIGWIASGVISILALSFLCYQALVANEKLEKRVQALEAISSNLVEFAQNATIALRVYEVKVPEIDQRLKSVEGQVVEIETNLTKKVDIKKGR